MKTTIKLILLLNAIVLASMLTLFGALYIVGDIISAKDFWMLVKVSHWVANCVVLIATLSGYIIKKYL